VALWSRFRDQTAGVHPTIGLVGQDFKGQERSWRGLERPDAHHDY